MSTYKNFKFRGLDKPTAELPALTGRQIRLLHVLHNGTISDLADELYKIAAEDAISPDAKQRDGAAKVAEMMANDKAGPRHASELLHTIEKSVIEALILNTIGYGLETDATFKDRLYQPHDNCHGTYVVTFARMGGKDAGKGLTSNEWRSVKEMMTKYLDRENPDEELIYRLETSIRRKYHKTKDVMLDIETGKLDMEFKYRDLFLEKLENRMSEALDPSGTTKQLHAPCYVGCGENLSNRSGEHDPSTTMSNSAKPHALLHSCLKELKIAARFIRTPILKTWLVNHYQLGEVIITLLTSSMFIDGGFNGKGPGTARTVPHEDAKFKMALMDVFVRHSWTKENMAESQQAIDSRLRTHALLSKPTQLSWDRRLDILQHNIDITQKTLARVNEKVDRGVDTHVYEISHLEEYNARLRRRTKQMQRVHDFHEMAKESGIFRSLKEAARDEAEAPTEMETAIDEEDVVDEVEAARQRCMQQKAEKWRKLPPSQQYRY